MRIVTVIGNPNAGGRTSMVAGAVAGAVADHLPGPVTSTTVELADLGPRLLAWTDPVVAEVVATVTAADVLVVASPTYKASYTGLLKLFLDRIAAGALDGVVTVPVMVGGAPNHALAVEVHLRPVLVELGACMPAVGLYVLESQLDTFGRVLDTWWDRSGPSILRSLGPAVVEAR